MGHMPHTKKTGPEVLDFSHTIWNMEMELLKFLIPAVIIAGIVMYLRVKVERWLENLLHQVLRRGR